MKKTIFTFLILFIKIATYCQSEETFSKLNLDFEITEKGSPKGWNHIENSNYILALDSSNVKSGKYSVSIEYKEGNPDFKAWAFKIPYNYSGKKITLTGYIKTENVIDGYAGLWMRIDPNVAFENMNKNGVKGTTDWTKCEISLDMNPKKTKEIIIGGFLAGNGKIWLDNFNITVDGKEIKELKPFLGNLLPADQDKEFDDGSHISSISADKNQIENIKTLGIIWGFLKYYHPNIAKGDYNWDYELFRILPKVLNSENQKNRDEILEKWIAGLEMFSEGKEHKVNSSLIKTEPDLDWITTSNFPQQLATSLLNVKNAKRSQNHYYIGLIPGLGNPDFKNENPYSSIKFPDAGFRLLALFRYWNMVQYYFPYKNLIEEDWKNVLAEFIPKVINAKNETEYTLTFLELIGRIHDTHANIFFNHTLDKYLGLNYTPLELTFIENKPVVTGYHDEKLGKETGLEIGDIITVINNLPVEEIVKSRLKLTPASNYAAKLRNIAPELLRTNDSTIEIEFNRNDKKQHRKLITFPASEIKLHNKFEVTDTCFQRINKDIAYVNNGSLKRKYLPKIWKEIENTKGLIIDDRNYPSDNPGNELSNYLMPLVSTKK